MAITITTQKILDSPDHVVLKSIITGTNDEEVGVLYDPNLYIDSFKNVKVMKIRYELNGFSAYLSFDDSSMISLPSSYSETIDFKDIEGIFYNNPPQSGRISIRTNGLGAGDSGSIILILKKFGNHGFNVLDIDPDIWIDSSNRGSLVYDSNNIVSQYKDLSGNNNHFNQSGAGDKPTLVYNSLNNRDTVLFTRALTERMIEDTYGWPLVSTIFAVIRPSDITGALSFRILSSFDGSGGLTNGEWIIDIVNLICMLLRPVPLIHFVPLKGLVASYLCLCKGLNERSIRL